MSGFDERIEAVRADPMDVALKFNADLRCGLTGTQVQNLAGLIAKERDHLTKANEELRAEVELAKQEGVTETLQQIDCLTGGDGEYRLSTSPDRNCPDEDAMRAKIVERFDDLRATIDQLQTTIKAFNNGMPAMTTKEVADENADLRATIDRLTREQDDWRHLFKRAKTDWRNTQVKLTEAQTTVAQLTKDRDQAVAEADPELLTIAWMDGSHRSAKAARDEIKRLTKERDEAVGTLRWAHDTLYEINPSNYDHDEVCKLNDASVEVILGIAPLLGEKHGNTDAWWHSRIENQRTRLSAMQEAIDEADRARKQFELTGERSAIRAIEAALKPFATKPEPEVDPLAPALKEADSKTTSDDREYIDMARELRTALAARGGRVVFDGREG